MGMMQRRRRVWREMTGRATRKIVTGFMERRIVYVPRGGFPDPAVRFAVELVLFTAALRSFSRHLHDVGVTYTRAE